MPKQRLAPRRLPVVPEHCSQPHHLFHLVLPSARSRDELIRHLADRGILAVFHYLPLHLSRMGQQLGGRRGDCPVTEDLSARVLRLPLFFALQDREQEEVIEAVCDFEVR